MRVSGHVPASCARRRPIRAVTTRSAHQSTDAHLVVGPKDDTRTLARFYLLATTALARPGLQRVTDLDRADEAARQRCSTPPHGLREQLHQKQGEISPSYAGRRRSRSGGGATGAWHKNSMNLTEQNAARYRAPMKRWCSSSASSTVPGAARSRHRRYPPASPAPRRARAVCGARAWPLPRRCRSRPGTGPASPPAGGARLDRARQGADLILIDAIPTANISDIRRISLVMKDGVTYLPSGFTRQLASSGSWIRRLFNLHAAQTHP